MKPPVRLTRIQNNKFRYLSRGCARAEPRSSSRKFIACQCLSDYANSQSHRLSTIMNADRIIVVENGEILEQGNHDELIVAGGRYADLWSKQVFVRTKEEDADVSAGQAGFVNDLSSEQTRTELSKVNKPTTATNEQPKSSEARASAEDDTVTQGRKQE